MTPASRIPVPTVDVNAKGEVPRFAQLAGTKPLPLEYFDFCPVSYEVCKRKTNDGIEQQA